MPNNEVVFSHLISSIRGGRMILYLGADVPVAPNSSPVWDVARKRLEALAALKKMPRAQEAARAAALAHGLEVAARTRKDHPALDSPGMAIVADHADDVHELRVSLAELLGVLTRAARASMEEAEDGLTPRQLVDSLAFDVTGVKEIKDAALGAVAEAAKLVRIEKDHPLLPMRGILRRVAMLASDIIGGAKVSQELEGAWPELARSLRDVRARAAFSGDDLEALQALLWHTIRMDIRSYPSRDELAFYLSLVEGSRDEVLRYALPSAALELPYAELVRSIQAWLSRIEENDVGELQGAIAELALRQYSRYASSTRTLSPGPRAMPLESPPRSGRRSPPKPSAGASPLSSPDDLASGDGGSPLPPIMITSTLDRGIERALAARRRSFHVLFPTIPSTGATQRTLNTEVSWVFRTYEGGLLDSYKDLVITDDASEGAKGEQAHPAFRALQGPVIIHPCGSPLEALSQDGTMHRVVLDESAHLASFAGEMKDWLHLDRTLGYVAGSAPLSAWFVGYSVADWDERLYLYKIINPIAASPSISKYSVHRPVPQADDSTLFAKILVMTPMHCDVKTFAAELQRALQTQPATSGGVL